MTSRLPKALFLRHPAIPWILIAVGLLLFSSMAINLAFQGPLLSYDRSLSVELHQLDLSGPGWLNTLMQVISLFGEHFIILGGIIGLIYWWRAHRWRELWMLLAGVLGGFLVFLLIGFLFQRARPDFPGVEKSPLPTPSFPSGHILSAVTFYGLLLYLYLPEVKSRAGRIFIVLAWVLLLLLIGFSRLYLAKHFLTDVMAGYGVGLAWAALVYPALDRYVFKGRERTPSS